jgi:PAS domain S-box-containing protein
MSQQQELYHTVFESASDAILIMMGGCITEVNPAAQALFNCGRDDLLGRSLLDFSPKAQPGGRESAPILAEKLAHADAGERQAFDWLHQRPDGESFYGHVALHQIIVNHVSLTQVSIRDISKRKQAEDALRESEERFRVWAERRGRQVQTATLVAQEIASAPDLDALYRRVVTLVKEQFGYYHTQLLRYDPGSRTILLIAGYGAVGEQMLAAGHTIALGNGLIGTAAAAGKSMLRADISTEPNWQPNPLLPHTKGEVAVPIILGKQLLGVLDVQSDEAGSLDTEDQLLLEGLCGQIAAAIESTRLHQEMGYRLQELHRLQRFFSQEGWQAYRARQETGRRGYLFNRASGYPSPLDSLPFTNTVAGGHENGQQGNAADGANQDGNAVPAITMPLTVRGAVVGTLGVQLESDRPLAPEDESLLEAISVQVAEALESARLLEQTQKRAGELETVARVSTAASTILQVDRLLQTVVDLAQDRFDLYHVSIFLYDSDQEHLRMAAASGDIGRAILPEQITIALNEENSLVAKAARERQALLVSDVHSDPAYKAHPLLPETRAEMVIPMILAGTLVGVLDVEADLTNAFTGDDLRIQTTLAAQVAVALQNAMLYAEQLETAQKLREVDRLKSEFLASMSHELRTPLNSIIGFADVLLEGMDGPLNARMEEDVFLIRESGRHLRELIGDILDMSKIEAGMMELRYEALNPHQIAQDVLATAAGLVHGKSLDIIVDVDAAADATVYADRTRLIQVMLNIIGNAVKFTDKGSIMLSMKLENDLLYTAVTDTGIGIAPEDMPIVFEHFRQVDGSVTRVAGGTGLGMPISKKLVELHGGEIGVESTQGQGTTFWFTLPKGEAGWQKPGTGSLRKPDTGPMGRSKYSVKR